MGPRLLDDELPKQVYRLEVKLPELASLIHESVDESIAVSQFTEPRKPIARSVKRLLDLLISSLLLVCVLPFFPFIALLIYLDSPGPIFFKPRVVGCRGRKFNAYKFRTMHVDAFQRLMADPVLLRQYQTNLKVQNDPRITRVGYILRKTSIDELPQLINVLRGEMSLVGPRILGMLELEKFGDYGGKVLSVKPGMAGLWVASGRHDVSLQERIRLEVAYVDNWSLWLDLKCFLRTILVALGSVGAH